MNRQKRTIINRIICCGLGVTFLGQLLFTATACNVDLVGYRELTIRQGVSSFTFEYPRNWYIGCIETKPDGTLVNVSASPLKAIHDFTDTTTFGVSVTGVQDTQMDARMALEKSLQLWRSQTGFQLIDQSETMVDGIAAQRAVFNYQALLPDAGLPGNIPPILTVEMVCFSRNSLLYNFEVVTRNLPVDTDNSAVKHILETFHILN
ncbi:MAG: hypothetical protein PHE50_04530 [Dehalococcoidales bacterium]|nr:hypothetical protein [Dehalococcoidales bacterium]